MALRSGSFCATQGHWCLLLGRDQLCAVRALTRPADSAFLVENTGSGEHLGHGTGPAPQPHAYLPACGRSGCSSQTIVVASQVKQDNNSVKARLSVFIG